MRLASLGVIAFALFLGPKALGQGAGTPVNFKIAFIGDQNLGSEPRSVLRLIVAEGADAVIHAGDFDYSDDPAAWDAQINAILGANFPYFAVPGNHDDGEWSGDGGYQDRLERRLQRLGLTWDGDLGVLSSLYYQGIFMLLVAPGIFDDETGPFEDYLRAKLAADGSIWRIGVWHLNMRAMQVGHKSDESGWGVYEACRQGGAIIATAHEHSYERTHLLSSMRNQTVASTDDTLVLAKDDPSTPADEGRSFAFISGLGGGSIRDQERCRPENPPYGCRGEWASIYTSCQDANYGALFGTFNYEGNPRRARFYFKDVDGRVPDEFFVQAPGATARTPECPGDLNNDGVIDVLEFLRLFQAWQQGNGGGGAAPAGRPEGRVVRGGAIAGGGGVFHLVDLRPVPRLGPCP